MPSPCLLHRAVTCRSALLAMIVNAIELPRSSAVTSSGSLTIARQTLAQRAHGD
jgi:hypothetical protein